MGQSDVFAYPYDQHDFPNGLRLITVPAPYREVVSLYIVVQAGSRNEVEEGRSGFAHFFEHMMFRGTPDYPPERYEAAMQAAGRIVERLHRRRPDRLSLHAHPRGL